MLTFGLQRTGMAGGCMVIMVILLHTTAKQALGVEGGKRQRSLRAGGYDRRVGRGVESSKQKGTSQPEANQPEAKPARTKSFGYWDSNPGLERVLNDCS